MEKERSLEADFARLEEITTKLEKEEPSLEEMFSLYEEGVKLVRLCTEKIDTVEKKMLLIDSSGSLTEEQ